MLSAQIVLLLTAAYLAAGLLFGLCFVTSWIGRLDSASRGASIAFRLLILPGSAALWPAMAARCLCGSTNGENS